MQHIDLILEESIDLDEFDFVSEYAPRLHIPDDIESSGKMRSMTQCVLL